MKNINTHHNELCESKNCTDEVFAACVNCQAFLCYQHVVNDDECINHCHQETLDASPQGTLNDFVPPQETPENFVLEGSRREYQLLKRKKKNQQKEKKVLRNTGKGYTQHWSFNLVAPKIMKNRCDGKFCSKSGKSCHDFTDEARSSIFSGFYGMGNLMQQREYIVRHISLPLLFFTSRG